MKLPCKAEKTLKKVCAKKGDARYFIQNPHLDAEKKILWATNGHIAARIPVETSETDVSGSISLEAITYAATIAAAGKTIPEIAANGSLDVGETSFKRPDGKFPDAEKIYQENLKRETKTVISIDAQLLHDLAAALSKKGKAGGVTLEIGGEKDAVLVISNDNSKAHGILMPVRNPINRD